MPDPTTIPFRADCRAQIPDPAERWPSAAAGTPTMTQPIPTVESMLDATRVAHRVHRWPTEGGSIDVAADVLRPALEAAYDPTMTDWPVMVEIDA